VLSYRTKDGRSRRATIGSLEDWTLGAARKRREISVEDDQGHG
jgi:hypothetical protein